MKTNNSRKVLLIHGYPQEISEKHPVYVFFRKKGFEIYCPRLFSSKKEFSLENAVSAIKKELKGNKPDIILGFSLGGLILPHVAKDFKDAKLIFASTGTKFNANIFFKAGLFLGTTHLAYPAFWLVRRIPYNMFFSMYKLLNPCGKEDDKTWYDLDKKLNYDAIAKTSICRQRQVFKALIKIDNSQILKKIKNRSVILGGANDSLMPFFESAKLSRLLENSVLIKVNKSHFSVIDEESLKKAYSSLG